MRDGANKRRHRVRVRVECGERGVRALPRRGGQLGVLDAHAVEARVEQPRQLRREGEDERPQALARGELHHARRVLHQHEQRALALQQRVARADGDLAQVEEERRHLLEARGDHALRGGARGHVAGERGGHRDLAALGEGLAQPGAKDVRDAVVHLTSRALQAQHRQALLEDVRRVALEIRPRDVAEHVHKGARDALPQLLGGGGAAEGRHQVWHQRLDGRLGLVLARVEHALRHAREARLARRRGAAARARAEGHRQRGRQHAAESFRRGGAHGARGVVEVLDAQRRELLERVAAPQVLRVAHQRRHALHRRDAQLGRRAALADDVLQVLEDLLLHRGRHAARALERAAERVERGSAQRQLGGADGLREEGDGVGAQRDHMRAVRLRELAQHLKDGGLGVDARGGRRLVRGRGGHPRQQEPHRRVNALPCAAREGEDVDRRD
mmetsp:Transcript_20077/g.48130  ORF Transcript_20077/g.48130 Transcript_20077/m.48130 type:complete len:443 (+) Transcript_20077:1312-2640(+)